MRATAAPTTVPPADWAMKRPTPLIRPTASPKSSITQGLKTVFTRRTDVFVDLYERAHIASLYSDYAFVSIHFNSAAEEARGLETYCLSPRGAASTSSRYLTRGDIQKLPGNDYDTQNILLASMVHSEIIKLNPGDGSADRGVKRARFVVIKQNVLPAILVEGGFVSNHMEAARVNRSDYRQSLAQAIARGVIRFANVMGDRHMGMPSGSDDSGNAPAPKAIPVAPIAPSGLANDPANGNVKGSAPATDASGKQKSPTAKSAATHKKTASDKSTASTPTSNKRIKRRSRLRRPRLLRPPTRQTSLRPQRQARARR